MTHPGVGPLTALATVLVLGPVRRFPGSKHVVSDIGLAPTVNASADKYRLGHISKQGSAVLRWVLGQAAPLAARARCRAQTQLLRRSSATRSAQGQGRPCPALARPSLRDAARPDRLRRILLSGPSASPGGCLQSRVVGVTAVPNASDPVATVPVRAFSG